MSLLPVGVTYLVLMICGVVDLFDFFVLPSLWISAMAAYVTSLACRFADWRGWRSNWYFGLLGTVVAAGLAGCFIGLGDFLQYGGWGKSNPVPFYICICVSGSVFAVLPSVLVARQHRKRFRDTAHAV
jgi:hypothetical protein